MNRYIENQRTSDFFKSLLSGAPRWGIGDNIRTAVDTEQESISLYYVMNVYFVPIQFLTFPQLLHPALTYARF